LPEESASKSRKGSLASSILRPADNFSVLVEHRCGTKKIDMVFDDNTTSLPLPDLLIDKLPAEEPAAPALSLLQIRRIQSILVSTSEGFSSDDDSSIPGDGLDFLDAPSLVDNDLPNNDFDMGQEERMFEQAKMYTDRGNGCFTNEEILSICLLGIMRDIGAPLKTYGRVVALFKDVIMDRGPITTTFRQRHIAINHFSEQFSMKGLYPTVLTQPSPLKNRFYPVPVHNAQAMIESLLYSSLAKNDNNLLFPNPDDPLDPPPSVVQNIADIDTSDVYRTAHKNLCTCPNQVVCGIICYIDKLATDRHGHLSLEPMYFTLSIFNKKTRNRPEAWRPLGYIPNIGLMLKAESTHAMKSSAKVQLYHDILSKIFGSLVDL
jgi:hypothetical protein